MQTLGERIKTARKEHGFTQTAFAEKIGMKQNSIARIESGSRIPSETVIKAICREFGISYNWLVNGVEPMKMPAAEADMGKLERIMYGDNEFVKFVFRQMADMPPSFWEDVESMVDKYIEEKKTAE